MGNACCPICGGKTAGKQVRGVNFCKLHRELAVFVRDHEVVKQREVQLKRSFHGASFIRTVRGVNQSLDKLGFVFVGSF